MLELRANHCIKNIFGNIWHKAYVDFNGCLSKSIFIYKINIIAN